MAQPDFATFRVTSVDGVISATGLTEAGDSQIAGTDGSLVNRSDRQRDIRTEVDVNIHSYVYHPNLLMLDFGLGLVRTSDVTESNDEQTRSSDSLKNYRVHATLLSGKPVFGTMYVEQLNQTPYLSTDEIFTQATRRYGFTANMGAPVVPVQTTLTGQREHLTGSSATRFQDDQSSRLDLRASRSWSVGGVGRTEFFAAKNQLDSNSGSVLLPTQSTRTDSANYQLTNEFFPSFAKGSEVRNDLTLTRQAVAGTQSEVPTTRDLRSTTTVRYEQNDTLTYRGSHNYSRNGRGEDYVYGTAEQASVSWQPNKTLYLYGDLAHDGSRSAELTSANKRVQVLANTHSTLGPGDLTTSLSGNLALHDQTAQQNQIAVTGERHNLPGTTATQLAQQLVVAGTVAVYNATRTQRYVEGLDYTLSVVGNRTRIQRLITGTVQDGEEVVVDYVYDNGGTYSSRTFDQTLAVTWSYRSIFSASGRFYRSAPSLTSGTPTVPLVDSKTRTINLRADVPLPTSTGTVVGGRLDADWYDDALAPYQRRQREVYVQGNLPTQANAFYRVGARRNITSSDVVAQTSDLSSWDLILNIRLDSGLGLYLTGLWETDNAGIEPRQSRNLTLKADWRYRKVMLNADLTRTHETQGPNERNRTTARVTLQRVF